MNTKLVTDYGQLAPAQSVDDSGFNLRKFVRTKINAAAETAAQQNAQLNAQMAQGYGEKSAGLGICC